MTDTDHELLVRHQIGPRQRALLIEQRRGWLLGSIGLAFAALTTLLALASLWAPGALSRELAALVGVVGCVWIWRLREAPRRWLQVGQDLRAGEVGLAEGPVTTSLEWSWGIVRVPRYRIRVNGYTFAVGQEVFAQVQPHAIYRVFYAPRSGSFLGAVPADPAVHPLVTTGASPAVQEQRPALTTATSTASTTVPLTQRELAILRLIAAGHSNQAIADELFLSVNTVKMYCSTIYQKLGVRRRTEAVAVARQCGLIDN